MKIEFDRLEFSCDKKFTSKDYDAACDMSERYFRTKDDPEQIPINDETKSWFIRKNPLSINVVRYKNKVIGSTFVLLSDKKTMTEFLKGEITEKDLAEYFKKYHNKIDMQYIYLGGAFIKEGYRGQGIAKMALMKQIRKMMDKRAIKGLFCWIFSEQGAGLARSIAKETRLQIFYREH